MVTYAASKSDQEPRIDELLASIQQILAEDPLSSRHEPRRGSAAQPRTIAKPPRPAVVFIPPAHVKVTQTARATHNTAFDELLAPTKSSPTTPTLKTPPKTAAGAAVAALINRKRDPAPASAATTVAATARVKPVARPDAPSVTPPLVPSRPISAAAKSAPTAAAAAETPAVAPSPPARVPTPSPTPVAIDAVAVAAVAPPVAQRIALPEAERKAAAAALDALALGLAGVAAASFATPIELAAPDTNATAPAAERIAAAAPEPATPAAVAIPAPVEATADVAAALGTKVVPPAPAVAPEQTTTPNADATTTAAPTPQAVNADAAATQAPTATVAAVATLPSSFDDTVAALLRPMLREWLDANLPRMVEKALTAELSERGLAIPTRTGAPAPVAAG